MSTVLYLLNVVFRTKFFIKYNVVAFTSETQPKPYKTEMRF